MRVLNIIALLLISQNTFAQVNLENLSLKNTKVKEMYKGWDNHLQIITTDTSAEYELRAKHSEVKNDPSRLNQFMVYNKDCRLDTLEILLEGKVVKTEYFEIKRIPDLKPFLFAPDKYELTAGQIEMNPKVYCWPFYNNLKISARVNSYTIIIFNERDDMVIQADIRSNTIPKEILEIIMCLKTNSKLIFEDIRVRGGDVCPRKLEKLEIKII